MSATITDEPKRSDSMTAQDPERRTSSLGEAFPKEQQRVRELLGIYKSLGPVGGFGAMMIEQVLQRADEAVISGDVAAMLRSYNELKGCQ